MTNILKFVVKCEVLGLKESFYKTNFGNDFSKAYQYAINDEKVCKGFKYVSIKFTHVNL
jgi:hypothetical protein